MVKLRNTCIRHELVAHRIKAFVSQAKEWCMRVEGKNCDKMLIFQTECFISK